ncbi:hypothetical protein D2V08_03415 [Flagellimonas lutimaris]|uniref:Phytase-like domain-containing protein n=1 Tax=Flagellimonas lutimaris TaxID=475082 RepID=A0A3A1ND42_9FLAO|nr:hypothetical protein [Allomuricauda lutimaris]RIV36008.1 hypothetical protein D2V08_03415 [Allomuricauda lutimaris]
MNNPSEPSVLIFKLTENANGSIGNVDILGFEIKNSMLFLSQIDNNKLFVKDLEQDNEEPMILKTNGDNGSTGYGELIIIGDRLFAKKFFENQFEVFELP